MNRYTKRDIIDLVEEEDVKFIRLQFTDIFGHMKNMAITTSQLDKALDNRVKFDGSAIEGFAQVQESDMYLIPDYDSFEIFPWRPQQGKVARLICDVYTASGVPFEGDPRYVLKKIIKEAESMGYTFQVGPECEFFLFNTDELGNPTAKTNDEGGYFDLAPIDNGENCRREICLTLEDMGFEIESSHHEVANGQHEIDFKHGDALTTADRIMTFKLVVKTIARRHGLHATFMPKPIFGASGSGMHINMSLMKDGENVFYDANDKIGLSKIAYNFMAGILHYIPEFSIVTNPLINSYKRLIPGYEAPCYIAWSANNRSLLVRVPAGREDETRIELRSPDPAANPYLVLAACLASGLEGIKKNMLPPASVNANIFKMSEEERKALGIENLPVSLNEAINLAKGSDFVKSVLGEHLFDSYIQEKKKEYDSYRARITQWEIDKYLIRY
ncbi:MAG: type I glutamate--ammonia ligase [Clostridia bacterium]|nr:type I glutamate--ammonia ligase [Clostridia bacterium]